MTENGKGLKSLPPWMRVTFWGTVIVILAAILVPAGLRTFMDGLRGDLDPDVIAAKEHAERVEITRAKALDTINAQKSRIERLEKILSSTGSKDIPVGVIMRELPPCELEDGSSQKLCVWDGRKQGNGVGAIVVNLDHGKISFYPQTNGWVVNK